MQLDGNEVSIRYQSSSIFFWKVLDINSDSTESLSISHSNVLIVLSLHHNGVITTVVVRIDNTIVIGLI